MKEYALLTDATVDLPCEILEQMQVTAIGMPVRFGSDEFIFEPFQCELTTEGFYKRLIAGEKPETAQINMTQFVEAFRPFAEKGMDILYLGFSSGLSGTYQSSLMAVEEMRRLYPQVHIRCVDTLSASIGVGALVYKAAQLKQQGMAFDELADWVEANRLKAAHWFTVEDLMHLHRGGRLSMGSAVLGTALSIKPLLTMDDKGRLKSIDKVRGRVKALRRMVELMETTLAPDTDTVIVGHGNAPETAQQLAAMILKKYPNLHIIQAEIGPVIGSHTGPGMVAAAYMGRARG